MVNSTDGRETTKTVKLRRNGFIAFLLSLLLPGLGQVYNGQLKKGIVFFLLFPFVHFLFGLTHWATLFYGLFSLLVIEITLRIYIIIDSVKNAKRQNDYVLKPYNTWYYHLLIAIAMIAALMICNVNAGLGIETFKSSGISNNPTIQEGDCLIANMKAYKTDKPDYGDIVVYIRPNGQTGIFRVVGKPNDKIEINGNIVSINGQSGKARFIKETRNDNEPVDEFEEELPNGHKHLIDKFRQPYDSTKSNIKNIVVPAGCYYLLGDNRDNAADSRYEGAISKNKIKGRVICSYWGQTMSRINIDFRCK